MLSDGEKEKLCCGGLGGLGLSMTACNTPAPLGSAPTTLPWTASTMTSSSNLPTRHVPRSG